MSGSAKIGSPSLPVAAASLFEPGDCPRLFGGEDGCDLVISRWRARAAARGDAARSYVPRGEGGRVEAGEPVRLSRPAKVRRFSRSLAFATPAAGDAARLPFSDPCVGEEAASSLPGPGGGGNAKRSGNGADGPRRLPAVPFDAGVPALGDAGRLAFGDAIGDVMRLPIGDAATDGCQLEFLLPPTSLSRLCCGVRVPQLSVSVRCEASDGCWLGVWLSDSVDCSIHVGRAAYPDPFFGRASRQLSSTQDATIHARRPTRHIWPHSPALPMARPRAGSSSSPSSAEPLARAQRRGRSSRKLSPGLMPTSSAKCAQADRTRRTPTWAALKSTKKVRKPRPSQKAPAETREKVKPAMRW
mmetsp:Transcript_8852/g.23723  ORF Transcript_8852/g.23723 Transcript_8852/m.23723 type:complete len:357 (-) Transcript_8852:421-1491(-)